jgi:hypothetical protein
VTQNNTVVVEKYSGLSINNKIINGSKEANIDFNDPA